MVNKRSLEVTVAATFITCIILIFFYGFKYFAGFQYASQLDRVIISFLGIIFLLCLLYFVYRFFEWAIKTTMKFRKFRGHNT